MNQELSITGRQYYPMLFVREGEDPVASLTEIWGRYARLSQEQRSILKSGEMPERLFALQKKFGLSDNAIGEIAIVIRELFFGQISSVDIEKKITDRLRVMGNDVAQAQLVAGFVESEILTIKPQPEVEETEVEETRPRAASVKMPLLQALSKYEQLGNQLITRERIKIKSQQEPVRPSLLYWIKYYRDELGIGHHDSVQRGNFLFRSENGKRLSAEERERVNLVLKSVEENFPLEIDTERSEIIFPVFETPAAPSPVPRPAPMAVPSGAAEKMRPASNPAFSFGRSNLSAAAPAAPTPVAQGGEMSFSSKHVFPAEKSAAPQTVPVPQSPSANTPAGGQTVPRSNPFRIRPVSLGKEE